MMFWTWTIETWKNIALILSGISPLITLIFIVATVKLGKELKRQDTATEFNRRFDQLLTVAMECNKALTAQMEEDAKVYYGRFFSLQFDEFMTYHNGFIQREIFTYWMKSRSRDYIIDAKVGGISYRDAWTTWSSDMRVVTHSFIDFMKEVHQGESKAEAAVRKYRPSIWRRII